MSRGLHLFPGSVRTWGSLCDARKQTLPTCCSSPLKIARRFKGVFGDDFYLEVHRHGIDEEETMIDQLPKIAKKLDIEIMSANDCHYRREDDFRFQDAKTCVSMSRGEDAVLLDDSDRNRVAHENLHIKTPQEMRELIPEIPEAADTTMTIREKLSGAKLDIGGGNYHFPDFPLSADVDSAHFYLKKRTWEGLQRRYGDVPQSHIDRAAHELRIINQMGFPNYFLIVADQSLCGQFVSLETDPEALRLDRFRPNGGHYRAIRPRS